MLESASTKDPVSGSKTSYGQNVVLSLAKNKQEWSLNYNMPTPFRILMQKKDSISKSREFMKGLLTFQAMTVQLDQLY